MANHYGLGMGFFLSSTKKVKLRLVFSRRNSRQDRCPTVKWSGIQTVCEESQSDVLILLDCCASGLSNRDEGGLTLNILFRFAPRYVLTTSIQEMEQPSFWPPVHLMVLQMELANSLLLIH
jgi:hypothetical protein